MMGTKRTRWTIASARQQLPALISSAAREPQAVYRRDKLVATVVGPEAAAELEAAREHERHPRLGAALAELRAICGEEGYELAAPARRDRRNPLSGKGR